MCAAMKRQKFLEVPNCLFDLNDLYYQFDFHDWEQCANANIQLILLVSFLIVGAVLLVTGLFRMRQRRQ